MASAPATARQPRAFLSYAHDRQDYVRQLVAELDTLNCPVWVDFREMLPGDSITASINAGISASKVGIVLFTPEYLKKHWTNAERNALVNLQNAGEGRLIPILLDLEPAELRAADPLTADKVAIIATEVAIPNVAKQIVAALDGLPAAPHSPPIRQSGSIRFYAALAGMGLLIAISIVALMIGKAQDLARFGLTDRVFYIALLPAGFAAAAFAFGAMRSFGVWRGELLDGTLEIGGPAVAILLVVIGGLSIPAPGGTFPVTVYLHGLSGPQDIPLRQGRVKLKLGPEFREANIGANGEAYFPAIPFQFKGAQVDALLESDRFQIAPPGRVKLGDSACDVTVERKALTLPVMVMDEAGRPLPGAEIRIGELRFTTSAEGVASVQLPGSVVQEEMAVSVRAPGFEPETHSLRPYSQPPRYMLRRQRP